MPFAIDRVSVEALTRLAAFDARQSRIVELLCFGAAVVALGMALEARIGQRQPQGWEFYAIVIFLFLTFAFPGFVWRILRRRRG